MRFFSFDSSDTQTPNTAQKIEKVIFKASAQAIDLLVIVDNSASMANELNKLGQSLNNLTQSLSLLDWQICLTTTDADLQAGQALAWVGQELVLKSTSENSALLFQEKLHSLSKEIKGSGIEQPIKSANKALLLAESLNQGCFRQGVAKSILILSDEDELSDGWIVREGEPYSGLNPTELNYPESLAKTIKSQFPNVSFVANVIGIINEDQNCLNQQRHQEQHFDPRSAYPAVRLTELAKMTEGTVQSICESDFNSGLEIISQHALKALDSVEIPCTQNNAEILSISYGHAKVSSRQIHQQGTRLHFIPALTGQETAEITYICI